jgi:hypothetical protein
MRNALAVAALGLAVAEARYQSVRPIAAVDAAQLPK